MSAIPIPSDLERFRRLIADAIEISIEEVTPDALFYEDLEVDSLQKIEISAQIERKYGVQLSLEESAAIRSVADAWQLLGAKGHRPELVQTLLNVGRDTQVCYTEASGTSVTYAQLKRAVCGYADVLHDLGVPAGSRGMVVADDSIAAVVAILGLWWYGCVPVPVSPMLTTVELAFIVHDCQAAFAHLDLSPKKRKAVEDVFAGLPTLSAEQTQADVVDNDHPASWAEGREMLVQYTSGSTGTPKGVLHGRVGVEAVLRGFGTVLDLRPEDVMLSTAKLSFGYGFGNSLLFPLAAGASTVLLSSGVDAQAVYAALRSHRPTVLCSVPRLYAGLTNLAGVDPGVWDQVRLAVSAGEHLPADLSERIQATIGAPVVNGLGATEVLHIAVSTRPGRSTPGSTGVAVPGATISVRDEQGRVVPDGMQGHLHIAGPMVALGYLDRPGESAKTFTDSGAYTGDIVQRTAGDGEIQHLCRADHLLNLGGFKVSPLEIEDVIRKVAGVADCAVVGDRNPDGLEVAVAYAVGTPNTSPEELRRAILSSLRAELAPFKRPVRIEVLDALPVTSTGKLARFKLQESA